MKLADKLRGSHMQIPQPQEQIWHLFQLCVHSSPGSPRCALSWQSARSCFYFEPKLIELLFAGFWLHFSTLPGKELREQTAFLSYCYCLGQLQTAWQPHVLGAGQGNWDKWGVWHLLLAARIRLSWLGKDARKILTGISDVTREGRGLSLPQEKGCKSCFLLRLLKGISIQIFCDLSPWEICIERGNRNNERGERDYVEFVGKYDCSCFSWSFRSQSLKEREEPFVVPGFSCGSECLHDLSQVLYCSSSISGTSVSDPALVSGQVRVVCWQLCFSWAVIFILPEPQICLQQLRWSTEALMVLWMGNCFAAVMCFPLRIHGDIFYPALDACFLAPDNPLWLVWTCVEVNWSGACVFACLLGCCRHRGCRKDHEAGVALGEENRFVINRKEQMALVVMPIFIFDVNIPPRAPALQWYVTQLKSIWGGRG